MVITEEIDLTLESDFAAEYNKWLKPQRARDREYSDFWNDDLLPVIMGLVGYINASNMFFLDHHKRDSFVFSLYDSYLNILGEDKRALSVIHDADPYAAYFWGDSGCDCCGVELNVLNSGGYSLCQKCYVKEEAPMELN